MATTPRLPSSLLFQTHVCAWTRTYTHDKRIDPFFPCVRPCVSWCPGLWRLLCVACDRLEMWQLSLCQTKSGQSHNTHKHTHLQMLQRGLYCRAGTEEVRALCPPSSPNFKCHAHRNGAAWLTAGLLRKDMSSFEASSVECPCTHAGHSPWKTTDWEALPSAQVQEDSVLKGCIYLERSFSKNTFRKRD